MIIMATLASHRLNARAWHSFFITRINFNCFLIAPKCTDYVSAYVPILVTSVSTHFSTVYSAGSRMIYSVGPVWMPYLILLDRNVKLCFRLSRTHFCAYVRSKTAKSQKCLYEIIPFLKISLGSLHTSEVVCPVYPAISSGEARRRKRQVLHVKRVSSKRDSVQEGESRRRPNVR